jgi:uncharacterized protein
MSYNILSLDGGGIRGIILLQQLIELELYLGDKICNKFDLISGTSTGGIIAALLAKGYTAKEILDFYLNNSSKIFKRGFLRFGIFRSKYSDKNFNRILKEHLCEIKLSELECDVIIPAYNINKREKRLFKSTKDLNSSLYDVVRATASPQSFFPSHKIDNDYYIDGGMVINNPSLISYSEAVNNGEKEINLISFSTGVKKSEFNTRLTRKGAIFWAKPTVDILLVEQSKMTDFHMQSIANRDSNINYVRCNSIIEKSSGKIDDASKCNINNMILDGLKSADLNNYKIKEFAEKITK